MVCDISNVGIRDSQYFITRPVTRCQHFAPVLYLNVDRKYCDDVLALAESNCFQEAVRITEALIDPNF